MNTELRSKIKALMLEKFPLLLPEQSCIILVPGYDSETERHCAILAVGIPAIEETISWVELSPKDINALGEQLVEAYLQIAMRDPKLAAELDQEVAKEAAKKPHGFDSIKPKFGAK